MVQSSPKGAAGLVIAVAVVLAVLVLNAMDFADWEDSDYISVIDLGFFLLALGWMLWPRQPDG